MWIYILSNRHFEDAFKNTQWRKFKAIPPAWLYILWYRHFEVQLENIQTKSNKCNHCHYASPHTGHLNRHLKSHNSEKSNKCTQDDPKSNLADGSFNANKCNQCEYSSYHSGHFRTHLKTHYVKSKKCNHCDYASSRTGHLKRHLKTQYTQPKQPNIISGKQFIWVKEVQPVWIFILQCRLFKDTLENTLLQVKRMQPLRLCIISHKSLEETHEITW